MSKESTQGCGAGSYPPDKLETMLWAHQAHHPYGHRCTTPNDDRTPADAEDRSGCMYNEVRVKVPSRLWLYYGLGRSHVPHPLNRQLYSYPAGLLNPALRDTKCHR